MKHRSSVMPAQEEPAYRVTVFAAYRQIAVRRLSRRRKEKGFNSIVDSKNIRENGMKMKKIKTAVFIPILAITLSITANLRPAVIEGVHFSEEYSAGKRKLNLRGYAVLNYMLVIKAYAGALYMENGTPSSAVLGNTPKILELHYFHNISAADFRKSTAEMIRRNTTEAEFNRIRTGINTLNGLYRPVKPGDRYRAEYIPDRGTTLHLNGKPLGTVAGVDFARAFFSIWIGKNPIDKKFRDRLLGR